MSGATQCPLPTCRAVVGRLPSIMRTHLYRQHKDNNEMDLLQSDDLIGVGLTRCETCRGVFTLLGVKRHKCSVPPLQEPEVDQPQEAESHDGEGDEQPPPGVPEMEPAHEPVLEEAILPETPPLCSILVRFDGASRGNPGRAAIGGVAYIREDGVMKPRTWFSRELGVLTNNAAEFEAGLEAVRVAKSLLPEAPCGPVRIMGDCNLLVKQITEEWRCKKPHLRILLEEIKEEISGMDVDVQWYHIPRTENPTADALANAALDGDSPETIFQSLEAEDLRPAEEVLEDNVVLDEESSGNLLCEALQQVVRRLREPSTTQKEHMAAWRRAVNVSGGSVSESTVGGRKGKKKKKRKKKKRRKPESPDSWSKVLRLLRNGEDSKAFDALNPLPLAPANEDTLRKLRDLHPEAQVDNFVEEPLPLHAVTSPTPDPLQLSTKEVMRALFSSRSSSAPGPSGIGFQDLKLVAGSKAGRLVLTDLVNLLLEGAVPSSHPLRESTIVALDKGGGKVRPIAIGETIYRLASKAVVKAMAVDFAEILSPHQFGVCLKGGSECLIHLVKSARRRGRRMAVASLDVTNAFNSVDRSHMRRMVVKYVPELLPFFDWAYQGDVVGWWQEHEIISAAGVKQGCPLSPFFFALAIKEILAQAAEEYPECEVGGYLDDINVVGESPSVADCFSFLSAKLAEIGLAVNTAKTQLLLPENPTASEIDPWRDLVDEVVLEAPSSGLLCLGVPIGPPVFQMERLFDVLVHKNRKLDALEHAMKEGLPPQAVMRLVANCLSCQPNYWLRTIHPDIMGGPVNAFWRRLLGIARFVLQQSSSSLMEEWVQWQFSLPVKMGGLGWGMLNPHIAYMASVVEASSGLEECGRGNCSPVEAETDEVPEWLKPIQEKVVELLGQDAAVFGSFWNTPKLQKVLTSKLQIVMQSKLLELASPGLKVVLKSAAAKDALAWVYAAPRKGFIFTPTEYAKALRLMLGLPQTHVLGNRSATCCGSHVDSLAHHALSCGAENSAGLRTIRHHALCRVLVRALRECRIPVEVETKVQDGIMDIIAHDDHRDWLIDVTIPSPLTEDRFRRASERKLATAKQAEKAKMAKYAHLKEPDREVIPFAVEATGGFGPMAEMLLRRLAQKHRSRLVGLGERRNFRKLTVSKLSVTLMRHNVRMLEHFLGGLGDRLD